MALNRKRTIILAGGIGGGVLVVTVITVMIAALASSVAEFSEDAGAEDAPLQFSVVQQQPEEEEKPTPSGEDDFENRTAAYAAGEKRLEEEENTQYVSSTSFGSGFKNRREEVAEQVTDSAPKSEPEVKPASTKPAVSSTPKSSAKKQPAATAQAVAEAPKPKPTQEVRTKRTRYADAEVVAPAAASGQAPAPAAGKTSFRAKIFEDVEIVNSAYVKVRVLHDFDYEGCTIRRNTMLTAEARRGSRSVEILIYNLMACGKRISTNFTAYSLDGIQGLPVREDNAAEVGVKEGRNEAVSGAASGVANRATGVMGIVGSAVAAGVSGGTRASQQVQPVLVEEGREVIFMMN